MYNIMPIKYYIVRFISIVVVGLCFSSVTPVFSQTKAEKEAQQAKQAKQATPAGEEEKPRLSRESQLALVEAQRAFEKKDLVTARKVILDYMATNPPVLEVDVYLMLGYFWYSDSKLDEAQKVFKEGYTKYPDNYDLLSYLASCLYENQKYEEAGPLLEKAYEKSTKKGEVKLLEAAAAAYYQIKKYDESIRIIRKIISISKDIKEPTYQMMIGLYLEQEKYDDAQKVVFEALDKFPLSVNLWQQLGLIRQAKDDYAGLAGALEIRNTIKPPEKPEQWKQTISIYQSVNLPLRVARSIELSLKGENAKDADYIKIAEAYAKAMKTDKAINYLDTLIKKNQSSALMLKKAEILYNARRNKETIVACDEVIAKNPNEAAAYFMKGNAAWDMEDWDTMKAAFLKIQGNSDYKAYAKNGLEFLVSLDEAKTAK
jgi:tetratricopeptide (TPR) repeat protein